MRIQGLIVFGLILVTMFAFNVAGVPADIVEVELDNDELSRSGTNFVRSVDKGEEFQVKVHVEARADVDDVQVEAFIRGYDHNDRVEDISDVFDMRNGTSYVKKLDLSFPQRLDQDRYKLRVIVADRAGETLIETYELEIEAARHEVVIKDVVLSPSSGVKAGRALLSTVRVQNYGRNDEDDVKITFAIPELGVSASDYIDELEADGDDHDAKSTEELYLRIPQCADAGIYEAEVEVQFHDLEKTVRKTMSVEVIEDETCNGKYPDTTDDMQTGKTVVSVGPESQDVTKGTSGVIYPVTITNSGRVSKTYAVSVTGGDWGNFRVSPSNVVTVAAGETKTAFIFASAKEDAPSGTQVFGVSIKSGDSVAKEVTLTANVVGEDGAAPSGDLKRALEIGLIVLVVILVILGLIIGFNKLKGDDEEGEEGESYY